jgi:hypothetical protein
MILMDRSYTAWRSDSRALGLGKHNYCRYIAQGVRSWQGEELGVGCVGEDQRLNVMNDPVGGTLSTPISSLAKYTCFATKIPNSTKVSCDYLTLICSVLTWHFFTEKLPVPTNVPESSEHCY